MTRWGGGGKAKIKKRLPLAQCATLRGFQPMTRVSYVTF